jgi:hypothetical protein
MVKITFFLVFITLGVIPAFAQNRAALWEDAWVCPVFESGLYGISNIALGGGTALGYGNRVALGFKAVYWSDREKVKALELNFLMRFYFFDRTAPAGLFIQFNGGPVLFAGNEDTIALPAATSMISAGLSMGWRFLFGNHFFIEPAVRAGYPYIAGAGLSAGVRL